VTDKEPVLRVSSDILSTDVKWPSWWQGNGRMTQPPNSVSVVRSDLILSDLDHSLSTRVVVNSDTGSESDWGHDMMPRTGGIIMIGVDAGTAAGFRTPRSLGTGNWRLLATRLAARSVRFEAESDARREIKSNWRMARVEANTTEMMLKLLGAAEHASGRLQSWS
jgi:hypothetical protein